MSGQRELYVNCTYFCGCESCSVIIFFIRVCSEGEGNMVCWEKIVLTLRDLSGGQGGKWIEEAWKNIDSKKMISESDYGVGPPYSRPIMLDGNLNPAMQSLWLFLHKLIDLQGKPHVVIMTRRTTPHITWRHVSRVTCKHRRGYARNEEMWSAKLNPCFVSSLFFTITQHVFNCVMLCSLTPQILWIDPFSLTSYEISTKGAFNTS